MKEIIRDLKTGRRKINVTGFVFLFVLIITLGSILSDVILICMGATFTWLGIVTFIAKFFICDICHDYLFED